MGSFLTRLASLGILLMMPGAAAADWPGFRGPGGSGVSPERGLPVKWDQKDNVVWKATLPGPGASSPIVLGERVFVTCWSGYGDGREKPGDMAKLSRHLVCLDRKSGKLLWQADVPAKLPELEWNGPIQQHGYATSTPVTDGERVYVYFGKTGAFAYNFEGKQLWHNPVGDMRNGFGSGASPVVYRNLLIVNATVESSRLVALDKATGKIVWRVRINGDCWTTPLVVAVGEKQELVFFAREVLYGFDPQTGEQLWECECPGPDYVSASPVARNGIVYVMGSGTTGRLCQAVRAGGRGDVTKTHVVWTQKVGASFCSPLLVGDHLYFFSGLAHGLRADTGAVVFQERLPGLGQEYSSPVAADGKIYLFTRRGEGHVLAIKGRLEPVARNDLGETGFIASPAVSRGQLFIRCGNHLYCLGEKQ